MAQIVLPVQNEATIIAGFEPTFLLQSYPCQLFLITYTFRCVADHHCGTAALNPKPHLSI